MATHTKPDEDAILSVALLKRMGFKIKGYWFYKGGDEAPPPQLEFKDVLWIDRGRRVFDHHGIPCKTSAQIVAEELKIAEEKWLRPILRHVHRADLEGRSEPLDLNDILKAITREITNDKEIMRIGIEIAMALFDFHEKNLMRNNALARKIIEEHFIERKMPERIQRYYQLLLNPKFQRSCDFTEIVCGAKEPEKLGKSILSYLEADIQRYQRAKEEVKNAQKIVVSVPRMWFIIAGTSDNPKFNTAARAMGAAVVIQRNTNGHTQIYFNNKVLPTGTVVAVSEDLIAILRMREITLDPNKKMPMNKKGLRSLGQIEEVPEWYLFNGERGGRLILNGSLTATEVLPSKIPFEEIIEFTVDVLRHYSSMGHGAARGGTPLMKSPKGKAVEDKAKKENSPKI